MMGVMVSPLRGADGNVEFLVHLRVGSALDGRADPAGAVQAALARRRARAARRGEPEG